MKATLLLALLAALVAAPSAAADLADERALAERHAPVIRLVEQEEPCGPGEPYEPIDVDALFDEPTVALRGPWNPVDLVKIAPRATDLVGLFEYHLDFPGHALSPGCDYERWADRVTRDTRPTVYAHVVADGGKVALQYWLFYVYNDWNNLHEGDWEMIQLVFEADDALQALADDPVVVGYSQHQGAERAEWDDDKLEIVDGRRPVVYPAAGSHANFFDDALYVGSSGEQGVGCDDTRGPHVDVDAIVKTIPSDPAAARRDFPWIRFEGRWGELQEAFFNGPTGPNMKSQWTAPIVWSEGWRDQSYAVPTGGALGTGATDFFCAAVARGSMGLIRWLQEPLLVLVGLAAVLALLAFAVARTTWLPAAPLRIASRRSWGQVLSSSWRMYVSHLPLFASVGLLMIPIGAVISALHGLVDLILGVDTGGEAAGALVLFGVALGTTLTLLGVSVVQAAVVCALAEIDEGKRVGPLRAYALALRRWRPLLIAVAVAVFSCLALSATALLIPVVVWLAVSWSLLAQVVELEEPTAAGALRRSRRLVRRHWLRVASLTGLAALIALAAGPFVGALLILLTDQEPALLNLVAGVVYALTMPLVALITCYVYFDLRVREQLEPTVRVDELPAEIADVRS